ncbi:hypothetical protein EIK77_005428 [Talaromyces pinophilus]|nr:hypothetical protein EIK77_005428 [Talaromyces pinophilus]
MQLLRAAFCPRRFRGSIRDSLRRRYVEPPNNTFPIQVSANGYNEQIDKRSGYGFWSAYRQLCLFLMRNFFGMSNCLPRGVPKYRGPYKQPDTHELWKQFTRLSEKLGFGTPHCPYRRDTDKRAHEYLAIYSLLRSLRPPDSFDYEDTVLIDISTKTCNALSAMREKPTVASTPSLAVDSRSEFDITIRCGMTDIETFFADQKYLYLQNMYRYDYAKGPYLTSFAMKRNMFLCFFGTDVPANIQDDDMENNMGDAAVPLPGRQGSMGTDERGTIPLNETLQPGIVESSVRAPVPEPVREPGTVPENLNGELVLASQPGNSEMQLDPLIEITSQDVSHCVCQIHLEPAEFVAYFIKSTHRQQGVYYLYNLLGNNLHCLEGMDVLARFRGNTNMVALLKPNREAVLDPSLHTLEKWQRNELYLLFPDSIASSWKKTMFTYSTISDQKFERMGLPTKDASQQWVLEVEEEIY